MVSISRILASSSINLLILYVSLTHIMGNFCLVTLAKLTPIVSPVDLDSLTLSDLYEFQLRLAKLSEDVENRIRESEALESPTTSDTETTAFYDFPESSSLEPEDSSSHRVDKRSLLTTEAASTSTVSNVSTVTQLNWTSTKEPNTSFQTSSPIQETLSSQQTTDANITTVTKSLSTTTDPSTQSPTQLTTTSVTTTTPGLEEPAETPQREPLDRPGRFMNSKTPPPDDDCQRLSQDELVKELKEKGTYNPDFMAWDVPGVIRFLEKATTNAYDKEPEMKREEDENVVLERNLAALERIMKELNVQCDFRTSDILSKMSNFTASRDSTPAELDRIRSRRQVPFGKGLFDYYTRNKYLYGLYRGPSRDDAILSQSDEQTESATEVSLTDDTKIVGQVHTVPFGCSKRGSEEEGYLRLCGACQAIRRLPDDFFPPFINEVLCDEDKACLYFYDYPHGKCKQKHMNFVVLRNLGTRDCQIWEKFNLNVRVSCECFVDEMSFFAKYV